MSTPDAPAATQPLSARTEPLGAETEPIVSVIVPAYQAEVFLDEALESALGQDLGRVELIVVDDGSTDRTAEIAASHGARVLRRGHGGPAAARNAGLAVARGEFVTILDADDVWPVDRLSRQVEHLREHPELGIVLGLTEIFLTPCEPRPAHWPVAHAGRPIPAVAGSMLARAEVFEIVGLFDETLRRCEDIDWLARVKDAGIRAGAIEHVVLRYRIHAANTSRETTAIESTLLRVLRDSVRRQREPAGG
jgi:glycosyltransferase involved in cell wall biosynthesis